MDERPNLLSRVSLEVVLYAGLLVGAAALRLWGLGLRPLSAGEAEHALAAWQLYRGLDYAPREPLYLLMALASFGWFGVNDAAARLAPALVGTAIVALPALLRQQLGRVGALAAATLLAMSPTFVFFSDSADGVTLAIAASLLLVAGAWGYLDSEDVLGAEPFGLRGLAGGEGRLKPPLQGAGGLYLAAAGLGLALAAGSAAYPLILTLALFVVMLLVAGRAPRPDRPLLIRAGLVCGGVLAVASTVALTRLDGVQEVLVNVPGRWLAAFVAPRAVPWEHALRLLVLYDLPTVVFGAVAIGFVLSQTLTPSLAGSLSTPAGGSEGEGAPSPSEGEPVRPPRRGADGGRGEGLFALFLVLWSVVAFLLATLAGTTPASPMQTVSVLVPLILLVGLFLDRLWSVGLLPATRGLLVVFVIAFAYVVVAVVRLLIWHDESGSEFTFAAVFILLAVAVLYWTWNVRPRWLGLAGVALVLLILSFHGATWLIYPPAAGPRDFLADRPTSVDVRLLRGDLDETAFRHYQTDWAGLDVVVIGAPDPLWGWLLRGQRVTYADRLGEVRPRVVVVPAEQQATLADTLSDYQRHDYTLGVTWSSGPFTWSGFVEWLLYHYSDIPPDNQRVTVYIRP